MERAAGYLSAALSANDPHVQAHRLEQLCFELWDLAEAAQVILVGIKRKHHEQRGQG
jgi:hypothetical protein